MVKLILVGTKYSTLLGMVVQNISAVPRKMLLIVKYFIRTQLTINLEPYTVYCAMVFQMVDTTC